MKIKLQLALDVIELKQAITLLDELQGLIDIVEVGTPMIVKEGVKPILELRQRFLDMVIFADVKITDGAKIEAQYAFDAGADIVSVLAMAELQTIKDTISVAHRLNKKVLVDLIGVKDLASRITELEKLAVDYLCVHNAFDVQYLGKDPLAELLELKQYVSHSKTVVAGGITLTNLSAIVKAKPDVIIIGGAITGSGDPKATTIAIRQMIEQKG